MTVREYFEKKEMEEKQMGSDCSSVTFEAKIGDCYVPMQALDMSVHEISEMLWMEEVRGEYTPKRILRHGPATIVFWGDGTKTVVKRHLHDAMDSPYTAFTAALAIKIFGSNSKLGAYFEFTYNGDKDEAYLDAYKKWENIKYDRT